MEDGGADVAWEGIGLAGWWRWGVSLGGDWLCVELFDDVDVGVINGGDRSGGGLVRRQCRIGWGLLHVGRYDCGQPINVGVLFCE